MVGLGQRCCWPLNADPGRRGQGARVEIAAREIPALILMDIQLPGMDGISALRELRKNQATSAIPVMTVTASAMPMERKEILQAGFDGYQSKPISVKELLKEIERLLGRGEGA